MKHQNCLKCKHYAGLVSRHYFLCLHGGDVIDTDYLTRRGCPDYDDIHDYNAVERSFKKDDQSLPDKE